MYLAPLFAVGLVKRNVNTNPFRWYMENGPIKDFINKVANAVPQIKLKEDEDEEKVIPMINNHYDDYPEEDVDENDVNLLDSFLSNN